jgi:hypothetical protein
MVTNSSSVPNTSTVLATTLKSIGKSMVKFFDFGQYVERLDGINECNLDQAVFLQDIMDCADEQLSVYNSSPSVFSDVIVSTKCFTPDGKAKLVGGEKVNLHKSILCALSINSSLCSDIFNRIKWKPWWCKFMFIIISVDCNGSYNVVPETVMMYYHKSKEGCITDKEAVLV